MSNNFGLSDKKTKLELVRKAISELERQGISEEDILEAIRYEKNIPASILKGKLSPLQAVVKFLFENKGLRHHQIAELLGRDQKTIGNTYRNAMKMTPERILPARSDFTVPVSSLSDRSLSFLESFCTYLKEHYNLTFHEIAVLIGKDDRTVWTVCKRAERKHEQR